MKLAVSSIAWSQAEEPAALERLLELGIHDLELVPGRLQNSPESLNKIKEYGFRINAFQSLLYGTENLHLFSDGNSRKNLFNHLLNLAELAEDSGAYALVFGSPKNRYIDTTEISFKDARSIALDFFCVLAEKISDLNVSICIEANPLIYNCNFLTTTEEVFDFVKVIGRSQIKANLDLGAIIANAEDLSGLIKPEDSLIGHVHISEPRLLALNRATKSYAYHVELARNLVSLQHLKVASIEMLRAPEISIEEQVTNSVLFVQSVYGFK